MGGNHSTPDEGIKYRMKLKDAQIKFKALKEFAYRKLRGAKVYHYTDAQGLEAIKRTGRILPSVHKEPVPGKVIDATFGDGVYATELGPETPRVVLATNNYLGALIDAGVDKELLMRVTRERERVSKGVLDELERQIQAKAPTFWAKTECHVEVDTKEVVKVTNIPEKHGGERRNICFVANATTEGDIIDYELTGLRAGAQELTGV